MNARALRMTMIVVALGLGAVAAALGGRSSVSPALAVRPPGEVAPFAVAGLLAAGSPEVVVIVVDGAAKHPLRGAMPMSSFGTDDAAFVVGAPKARRIVLVGADPVRVDGLARKLMAAGRDVRVLAGGLGAWDTAMDVDPEAPVDGATADVWASYRTRVALRRSFGDATAAPAIPVAAPVAPMAAPAGGATKKREGC